MRVNTINTVAPRMYYTQRIHFKGEKEELISEGLKEVMSEALPIYKGFRTLQKVGDGDKKGAVKQAVGTVDNIVCQPIKQAAATAVAAKGALIGSVLGPVGAGVGAAVGYFGTLLGWGKIRNKIVDGIMDD